jgi:hypothetical protein
MALTKAADGQVKGTAARLSRRAAAATAIAAAALITFSGAALAAAPVGASAAGHAAPPTKFAQHASDPSGAPMPVGNIPGWRQVFTDDFTEQVLIGQFPAAVSTKWGGYNGSHDTTGNGAYEPGQVVSIHDGVMDLYPHTVNGVHLVAAPEPIIPNATGRDGGMLYGRYEIRFKSQAVAGYKTAWLLWPDSNVWSDGEIDFPEGNLNSTFAAYMHHVGDPKAQDVFPTSDTYASWHTAIVEWTPSSVTFLLDGQVMGVSTDAANIPDTAMHWVLQTETRLAGGPPSDSAAGHVYIDWVAIYAYAPQR